VPWQESRAVPHPLDADPGPSWAAPHGPCRALGSGRPPPGIPRAPQRPHGRLGRLGRLGRHVRHGRWPNGSRSSSRSSSAYTTQPSPCGPRTGRAPTETGVAIMNPLAGALPRHPEMARARPVAVIPLRRADDEGRG